MITSTSNAKIRNLLQIKRKNKERDAQDAFLVEGVKMFGEIPPERIREVYVSESFQKSGQLRSELAGLKKNLYEVTDTVFQKMSDTQTPQGVMALVSQLHYREADLIRGNAPLVMILENLQDPGNLGTIIRTAEGAGVTGILITKGSADLYNPKVTRSTMGSIFRVPFCYTENLAESVNAMKRQGIKVFGAHLQGSSPYGKENYCGGSAFLIGNESRGLSPSAVSLADVLIRIPLLGKVESLNAAIASAVLMYEARRQREEE